jgi:hypothetical protein
MSRNADKMNRDRNRALNTLNKINETLINDLVRRASSRATSDSKPDGPRTKGAVSNPTLNAVMRSMSGVTPQDPIFDAVKDLAHILSNIADLSQKADDRIRFITDTTSRIKDVQVIHCEACLREVAGTKSDRLRSGYCQACYQAWYREGMGYRLTFELSRRVSDSA